MEQIDKQSFAQSGGVYRNTTTATTGEFCGILVIDAAVFSAIDFPELSGDSIVGDTIPAGVFLPGQIKSFTLASGKVFAVNSSS